MPLLIPMPMRRCRCRHFQMTTFIDLLGTTYFVELLMVASKPSKIKIFFAWMNFLRFSPWLKCEQNLELREKLVYYGVVWGCFCEFLRIAWEFLWCLWTWTYMKLFLLQVRILTMSSLQLLLRSYLKFWCEVLTIVLGCMRMFGDVSGPQLEGRRIFWKLKKML